MASRTPISAMASRAPSSAMASVVCSALEVPVLCSCPCLSWGASRVCFRSSSDVIISLFLSSRVCLIVYDYPLYISPVFWVWFRLVYSLLPGVSCLSALSCPALMSWLKTIIWVYVLVCVSLFLPRVCTVTDRHLIDSFACWFITNALFHFSLLFWSIYIMLKEYSEFSIT